VPYQRFEPLSKQATILIGLTVVGFMAFGLTLSYYRNILFDETLVSLQQENTQLQNQIEDGHAMLEYYQSAQYRDKYAKQNLNKMNPGERVLILSDEKDDTLLQTDSGALASAQEALYQERLQEMPVYLHWELFLFKRDKLDELKKKI
jgi:cell division protein FtsB